MYSNFVYATIAVGASTMPGCYVWHMCACCYGCWGMWCCLVSVFGFGFGFFIVVIVVIVYLGYELICVALIFKKKVIGVGVCVSCVCHDLISTKSHLIRLRQQHSEAQREDSESTSFSLKIYVVLSEESC